jgi:hypothetical protein
MTDQPKEPASPSETTFISPDDSADHASRANELFTHGLLSLLHERSRTTMSDRVARVMSEVALGSPSDPSSPLRAPRHHRRMHRAARIALIAAIAGGSFIALWSLPDTSANSARAAVMQSIAAVSAPGDRRYEIRIQHELDDQLPASPIAILDSRGGQFLLRTRTPEGGVAIAGHDSMGEWSTRRDGTIDRERPRRGWPRWATNRGDAILADSAAALMQSLTSDYSLNDATSETIDGRTLTRISGTLKEGLPPHLADRVDLWLDTESMIMERLEFNWDDRPPPPEGGPAGGPKRGPEGPDRRGGPDGHRPPREGPRPDGPSMNPDMPPPPPHDGPRDAAHDGSRDRRPPGPPPPGRRIRTLAVSRVPAPTWPEAWFSASTHEGANWAEPEAAQPEAQPGTQPQPK